MSQVLLTVWCNISGEAGGEIWLWSLSEWKGSSLILSPAHCISNYHSTILYLAYNARYTEHSAKKNLDYTWSIDSSRDAISQLSTCRKWYLASFPAFQHILQVMKPLSLSVTCSESKLKILSVEMITQKARANHSLEILFRMTHHTGAWVHWHCQSCSEENYIVPLY